MSGRRAWRMPCTRPELRSKRACCLAAVPRCCVAPARWENMHLEGDQKVGAEILRRALDEPLRQLVSNAGLEGSVIVEQIRRQNQTNYGFDVLRSRGVSHATLPGYRQVADYAERLVRDAKVCDLPGHIERARVGRAPGNDPRVPRLHLSFWRDGYRPMLGTSALKLPKACSTN